MFARRVNGYAMAAGLITLVLLGVVFTYAAWIVAVVNECSFDYAFPGGGEGYCR